VAYKIILCKELCWLQWNNLHSQYM